MLNHFGSETRTYRATGLLYTPVDVPSSVLSATPTFVIEGIRHILEGLDHVLFVLCMTIGAMGLRSLVGRIIGFTIGHTVTLFLGFFGFALQGVARLRFLVNRILLKYGYPPDLHYAAVQTALQQAEMTSEKWAA